MLKLIILTLNAFVLYRLISHTLMLCIISDSCFLLCCVYSLEYPPTSVHHASIWPPFKPTSYINLPYLFPTMISPFLFLTWTLSVFCLILQLKFFWAGTFTTLQEKSERKTLTLEYTIVTKFQSSPFSFNRETFAIAHSSLTRRRPVRKREGKYKRWLNESPRFQLWAWCLRLSI